MVNNSKTGLFNPSLGQLAQQGVTWPSGYQTGGPVSIGGFSSGTTEEIRLRAEIVDLRNKVSKLAAALAHPDRPLASSLQQLINTMDMSEVAGRSKPPFDHLTIAALLGSETCTLDRGITPLMSRDGTSHNLRVIGVIIEDTTVMATITPATYMIPTPSLTADKAFEATADLIAHMVVERVLKKMEIDDASNGPDTGNLR
jgi:hypothetical protein